MCIRDRHRTPAHPSHPPVIMTVWNDHTEVKKAGNTEFTSKSLTLSISDHSATHVDAPCHFNPSPEAASIDAKEATAVFSIAAPICCV